MKKTTKILIISLLIVSIISGATVYGFGIGDMKPSTAKVQERPINMLNNMAGQVLFVIQGIGIVLSILILIIIGIKYMTGSVEEKSEYKKSLLPYVIGAGMIFTGTTIPNLMYQIVIKL